MIIAEKTKVYNYGLMVVMSNLVYSIMNSKNSNISENIIDFSESRKYWMLKRFEFDAKSHKRNNDLQF